MQLSVHARVCTHGNNETGVGWGGVGGNNILDEWSGTARKMQRVV